MPIQIRVDRQKIETQEGKSLTDVLAENKIDLPDLAYQLKSGQIIHTDLVEDSSTNQVISASELKTKDRMRVGLHSGLARQHRREAFLMIKKELLQNDPKSVLCKKLDHVLQYDFSNPADEGVVAVHPMAQAAELDATVCIGCNKCVEACQRVGINYLKLVGEGRSKHVVASDDPKIDCIYCGQCTVNCPVKSAREQSQIQQVEMALADPELVTIVQMAPSVRASIGEEFGAEIGINLEKKLFTAFRQLGFNHIFDVNMGADITTLVEAQELVERIKNGGVLPVFTSCCPAWVKFVEFYYPEMIPHLTEARSPQIHSGGAYKSWWAEKEGIDPSKIRVISIMPCTSKKYEARHEKLKVDGMWPVDYVLTTRETAYLLKKNNINLLELEDSELDSYGEYSGAGAIYGATGGVMESALRTAAYLLEGKDLEKLEFEQVRGMAGIKKAEVTFAGKTLKVAVATLATNMHALIKEVKENPNAYHYIEFMACPGGCIGGGGQPIPASDEKTAKRIEGLYKIDDSMKMRQAHHNKLATEFVEYANNQPKERKFDLLYTHYSPRKKESE